MLIIGVIPARYASTRFPGKPLAKIAGKSMIERVYRQAEKADLKKVIVATDDERIKDEVLSFGGNVMLTREHPSGTDRIAEVADNEICDAVINIQGDEPLIEPDVINTVSESLRINTWADMTTAVTEIIDNKEIDDPNVVKTVLSVQGKALYFSRSRIPYSVKPGIKYFKHIGIYGYRKAFLTKFISIKPSDLEIAESLEQLRALENGFSIHVSVVGYNSIAVDSPEDAARVEERLKSKGKNI